MWFYNSVNVKRQWVDDVRAGPFPSPSLSLSLSLPRALWELIHSINRTAAVGVYTPSRVATRSYANWTIIRTNVVWETTVGLGSLRNHPP